MPPKRRASGPASKSQQSTLAFHGASNKVTKAGVKAQGAKKNILEDAVTKKDSKDDVIEIIDEPTTVEAAIIDQTKEEVEAQKVQSTPEEDQARRISDAALKKYWAAKEKPRMAPRVHQQDLSLHEKILREFDMSGHYGPCTGIARLKRWKRAYRLKLNPPIEVLAVLLKEMDKDSRVALQRSQVDELLNSKINTEAT
ncbi:hypothetical protein CC86DRAFT_345892 [Ophiobolus disseminans]|uniref:DNA polymerase delta subunit 4 n=1 Tax=Ophiobolus disseminans TaxID=1469910 RepID=A0A6A7A9H6_9PLEO|nr:hypothetical protein CC86DRAFT_345892 [Ophiobolus disseminans]